MKKQYQMDRESAVRGFRKQAEESEQELQLHLPLKEVAAALQEGVGHLMRQAGLELMQLIMDNEVRRAPPANVTSVARRSNPSAGGARKAFSSLMDRRFPSSVRACAAKPGVNNLWAATSCSVVASRSTRRSGTS